MDSASPDAQRPLHVVSVSLGSSERDKTVEVDFDGRPIRLERRGTDGDLARAIALVRQLDGQVDAFGLGGTDLYVVAAGRRYVIRDAARIAAAARQTPIVDGSGLKHTLEAEAIRRLAATGAVQFAGRRALLVAAVDRFGMAEALWEVCGSVCYGDLMFGLQVPLGIHRLSTLRRAARVLLPLVVRLPFHWIYPTGEKQTQITPKFGPAYAAADIIAGDFHLIRRFLPAPADPPPLAGKVILTNTTTPADVELLRERGAATLVTTTPRFDGRSFGTNVLEACFTALAGARQPLPPAELLARLDARGWQPEVLALTPAEKIAV